MKKFSAALVLLYLALAIGLCLAQQVVLSGNGGVTGQANTGAPVTPPSPAIAITNTSPLASAWTGTAYATTFNAVNGTVPLTWSQIGTGSLPAGLTLNQSTGTLSGTASTAGTYVFTIQVQDASVRMASQTFTLVVNSVTLTSISVSPSAPSIQINQTTNFTATGTYSDGSTQDLTPSAVWASSASSVASVGAPVTNPEPATCLSAGTTTISATVGSVVGSTTLSCGAPAPTLQSVTLSPSSQTATVGNTVGYTATCNYSDGTKPDCTTADAYGHSTSWSSSSTSVATVASPVVRPETVSCVAAGSSNITASVNGVSSAASTLTCHAVQDDLLAWATTSTRTTSHLSAPNLLKYYWVDADRFWWVKDSLGNPWDINVVNSTNIGLWLTENGDSSETNACQQLGYTTGCWHDARAYKRYLSPVMLWPRYFDVTGGSGDTVITVAGSNQIARTTNCELDNQAPITIGNIIGVAHYAGTVSYGGSVGNAITIQLIYYYSLANTSYPPTSGQRERFYLVKGFGQVEWDHANWSNGSYNVDQTSLQATSTAGGPPVPYFPCGPTYGSAWWLPYTQSNNATASLSSVTLTPSGNTVQVGGTLTYTATGHYNDGSTADITTGVEWTSSNPTIASINFTGSNPRLDPQVVTGNANGTVTITATDASGLTASALLTVGTNVCGAPTYNCSRSDVKVVQNPAVPPQVGPHTCTAGSLTSCGNLTGAGTVVQDPDFGNRIVRVTDANTSGGDTLVTSPSGSNVVNTWEKNDNYLTVGNSGAVIFLIAFNPTTMAVQNCGAIGGGGIGWSYTTSNVLYRTVGTQIYKYDFTNYVCGQPIPTPAGNCPSAQPGACILYDFNNPQCLGLDPDWITPPLSKLWRGQFGISKDDVLITEGLSDCTGTGTPVADCITGTGQGSGFFTMTYKQGAGGGCRFYNSMEGKVYGQWGPTGTVTIGDRFTQHESVQTADPNWTFSGYTKCKSTAVCTSASGSPYLWNVPSLNVVTPVGALSGHWVPGHSTWINDTNTLINVAKRPFTNMTGGGTNIIGTNPCGSACQTPIDMHESWNNVDPNDSYCVFWTTTSPDPYNGVAFPYADYNEVDCAFPQAVGNVVAGTVKRFAHTFITGYGGPSNTSPTRFDTQNAIGQVSQTGHFFAFSSDWLGTLGSEGESATCQPGTGTPGGSQCQGAVFVVELDPTAVAPTISVGVAPTTASVTTSTTSTFKSSITGSTNQNVNWSLLGSGCSGSACGTLSSTGPGTSTIYTAPASVPSPAVVTLTATSVANPTKSAQASITIAPASATGAVTVYPQAYPPGSSTVAVEPGTREPFSAVVSGTSNQSVTWYVDGVAGGNSSVGTISSSGIYKAPSGTGMHTVKAVSSVAGINAGTSAVSVTGALPSYSCAWSKGNGSVGNTDCTMTHDGLTRSFTVHIPAGFSPGVSGVVVGLSGTDVDDDTYCYQLGSGVESNGFALYSDGIPGSSPPMVLCPLALRVPSHVPGTTGPGWHSYNRPCSDYTNLGEPCPDDSDFIRQLLLAADKDNNLDLKQTMIFGTWTDGAPMALRAAVETGDLVASIGTLEANWRNPAGDVSTALNVPQGTYPVAVIVLGQTSTTAPSSMDGCGSHPASDVMSYTYDDMLTYWTITDRLTSVSPSSSMCNGYNSSGYGQWTGVASRKGTGGTMGTEVQVWNMQGAINKMYCSEGGICSPIVHLLNSTCNSITPCNNNMSGATGVLGAMCTGAGGYCDTMNTLLEQFREAHVKP